jgi:hypothetical protein
MASRRSSIVVPTALSVLFLLCPVPGASENMQPGIRVEMDRQKPLTLRVELRSGSNTSATLYRNRLPWGSAYSMILVAVTPDGRTLKKELPVDDPSPEQVTVDPKESIKGEIDLQGAFRGLDETLKKSAIHLFWAYDAPKELRVGPAGGWIFMPQRH